ncbi:MAG: hypothetical protein NTU66_06585 [Elusimicrobia bacterium]|nr:hypothetical protein [Elusimicrobiota bacterium]
MKQFAVLLIALSVTFTATVPRQLDAMVSDDTMNQAMQCQTVLLYYSFFSVLPIKIMNALFAGQPDAAAQAASESQSSKNNAATPYDLSVPGKTIAVKSVTTQTSPDSDAIIGAQILNVFCFIRQTGLCYCPSGWSAAVHQWMIMLPRGSIDDYIKSIITNVNKPIGIPSQLAFSLGGIS